MIYVERRHDNALQLEAPSRDIRALTVTNSFGMPSQSPDFLMEDIPRAQSTLKKGQAMIVSVVGTMRAEKSFTEDFVDAACLAKNAGALLIEANFSCPNVAKNEGCLYMTSEAITEIGTRIVRAVHPIPVIMKMGLFASPAQMRASIIAAARAGFVAIHGINTVSMKINTPQGTPALGNERPTGGVCGGQIRNEAIQFIKQAHLINREEKLGLALLGVGGATCPEHFDLFLENGANIAMTATGMMWDPYLAARYQRKTYA